MKLYTWRKIANVKVLESCETFVYVFMHPRQRAQEMWNWIYQLESEKFDFMEHMKHQKYEVMHIQLTKLTG